MAKRKLPRLATRDQHEKAQELIQATQQPWDVEEKTQAAVDYIHKHPGVARADRNWEKHFLGKNPSKYPLFLDAISARSPALVEALLEAGGSPPSYVDYPMGSVITNIIRCDLNPATLAIMKLLLEHEGCDLTRPGDRGQVWMDMVCWMEGEEPPEIDEKRREMFSLALQKCSDACLAKTPPSKAIVVDQVSPYIFALYARQLTEQNLLHILCALVDRGVEFVPNAPSTIVPPPATETERLIRRVDTLDRLAKTQPWLGERINLPGFEREQPLARPSDSATVEYLRGGVESGKKL